MLSLSKHLRVFCSILNFGAVVCAISIMLIVTASVALRYFFKSPLHFTEEIVGLLVSAQVFLSIPMATIDNRHIGIKIISQFLKGKIKYIVNLFSIFVTVSYLSWIAYEGYKLFVFTYDLKIKEEVSGVYTYPWVLLMPVCTILMLGVYILVATTSGDRRGGAGSGGST